MREKLYERRAIKKIIILKRLKMLHAIFCCLHDLKITTTQLSIKFSLMRLIFTVLMDTINVYTFDFKLNGSLGTRTTGSRLFIFGCLLLICVSGVFIEIRICDEIECESNKPMAFCIPPLGQANNNRVTNENGLTNRSIKKLWKKSNFSIRGP